MKCHQHSKRHWRNISFIRKGKKVSIYLRLKEEIIKVDKILVLFLYSKLSCL